MCCQFLEGGSGSTIKVTSAQCVQSAHWGLKTKAGENVEGQKGMDQGRNQGRQTEVPKDKAALYIRPHSPKCKGDGSHS